MKKFFKSYRNLGLITLKLIALLLFTISLRSTNLKTDLDSINNSLIPHRITVVENKLTVGALTRAQFFMGYQHQESDQNHDAHYLGLDFDLISKFAASHNLEINFKVFTNQEQLINALANQEVDVIVGGLSLTPGLIKINNIHSSISYFQSYAVILTTKNFKASVDNPLELETSIYYPRFLNQDIYHANPVNKSIEQLTVDVLQHRVNAAVVDQATANTFDLISREAKITPLKEHPKFNFYWYFNKNSVNLLPQVNNFIESQITNGYIDELRYSFFEQNIKVESYAAKLFVDNMESKYKQFQPIFKKYAGAIDWRLAMAIGYRESRWKPDAISPWGPSGIMMLTNASAKLLNVTDKLDATQSIRGGMSFLNQTRNSLVSEITGENRDFFTVAIYNVGIAKIIDARKYLKEHKKNPNSWVSLVKYLPEMTKVSENFKYGKIDGAPLADYVKGVRTYYFMILNYLEFVNDPLGK